MPERGVNLTEEQRAILAPLVFDKSALGWGVQRIAEHLGVHRNTVRSLIRKERQVRAAERTAGDAEAAIARYEKVVERAWNELEKRQSNGLAVPALLNSIVNAQSKIDEITGVRAPLKSEWKGRLEQQVDLSHLTDEQLERIIVLNDEMEGLVRGVITAEPPHEN